MWLSYLFGLLSYNILSLIFLYLINKGRYVISNRILYSGVICITYFIIGVLGAAITNDFYPYKENIEIILSTKNPSIGFEPFWIWLIGYLKLGHIQFIFLLQAVSFFLFYHIVRLLRPSNLVLFFCIWTIVCFHSIIGGRAFLFYMLYYLSIILMSKKNFILSIVLLFCCFFTHKTAYVAIPLFFLLMIPITKKSTYLIGTILFIGAILVKSLIINNIPIIYDYLSNANIAGAIYLTHEENLNTTGNVIWEIIPVIFKSILYILSIFTLVRLGKKQEFMSAKHKMQYRLLFWTTTISIALLLIDLPDPAISTRIFILGSLIALPYLISDNSAIILQRKGEKRYFIMILLVYLITNDIGILRISFINRIFE